MLLIVQNTFVFFTDVILCFCTLSSARFAPHLLFDSYGLLLFSFKNFVENYNGITSHQPEWLLSKNPHNKLWRGCGEKGMKGCGVSHVLCQDSWPPERISIQGQRRGLTILSFLYSNDLLKYERDRESF